MIITTTNYIEGYEITEYLGLVNGEYYDSVHLGLDFYRRQAYEDFCDNLHDMHADGAVGVSQSIVFGPAGDTYVYYFGTAVKIRKKSLGDNASTETTETTESMFTCVHCGSSDFDDDGYCNSCGMKRNS